MAVRAGGAVAGDVGVAGAEGVAGVEDVTGVEDVPGLEDVAGVAEALDVSADVPPPLPQPQPLSSWMIDSTAASCRRERRVVKHANGSIALVAMRGTSIAAMSGASHLSCVRLLPLFIRLALLVNSQRPVDTPMRALAKCPRHRTSRPSDADEPRRQAMPMPTRAETGARVRDPGLLNG